MRLLDIFYETLNTTSEHYSPLLDLIDDVKTFLKATKKYIDKHLEMTAGEIKDYEEKLNVVMERLTRLEKHKDEL